MDMEREDECDSMRWWCEVAVTPTPACLPILFTSWQLLRYFLDFSFCLRKVKMAFWLMALHELSTVILCDLHFFLWKDFDFNIAHKLLEWYYDMRSMKKLYITKVLYLWKLKRQVIWSEMYLEIFRRSSKKFTWRNYYTYRTKKKVLTLQGRQKALWCTRRLGKVKRGTLQIVSLSKMHKVYLTKMILDRE